MKAKLFIYLLLCPGLLIAATQSKSSLKERDQWMRNFFAAKEKQAQQLAQKLEVKVAPEIWDYFNAGNRGDWQKMTNTFDNLRKRNGYYVGSSYDASVRSPVWQPVIETCCAYEFFFDMDMTLARRYGKDVMGGIKSGSIYFGGTDPGRGVITSLSKDHAGGKPFFTITQNALADFDYLPYLRFIYGGKIYAPTDEDSQKCFSDYKLDVYKRWANGKLKPGQDVHVVNGGIQASGLVAVMEINAQIAKIIFDKNPNREFNIEESFAFDWMYPHLVPHDAIFHLNREPLATLPFKAVAEDHSFWRQRTGSLIGTWLKENTSLTDVIDHADRIHLRHDFKIAAVDPHYLASERAQKAYSKLRSASAGLYVWRAQNSKSETERVAMAREADYAFRQSFALYPRCPEAVFRYVSFLLEQSRRADAVLVAEAGMKHDPENPQRIQLLERVKKISNRN